MVAERIRPEAHPMHTCPTCRRPVPAGALCPFCSGRTQQWQPAPVSPSSPILPGWAVALIAVYILLWIGGGLLWFAGVRETLAEYARPHPIPLGVPPQPTQAPTGNEERIRTDAGLLPRRTADLARQIPCGDRPLIVTSAGTGHGDLVVMCERHHTWYWVDGEWLTYTGWQDRILARNRRGDTVSADHP